MAIYPRSNTTRLEASFGGDPSVIPYTHGLNGVNIHLDNITSTTLYGTIMMICVIITVVRLLQRAQAHIRHLTNFATSPQQQSYWKEQKGRFWATFKKQLVYAPIWRKRHNREIQLSSAVSVGTLPGRLHLILLLLYVISNVIYVCVLDYSSAQAAVVAELRGRTGHLATINMIALFLFAGRNNPLIRILRVSFDTMNLFHRWIGRVVVVEAVLHTIAWSINENAARGIANMKQSMLESPFLQFGVLGTVAMLIILIQSPSVVRHAFYETFLLVHQVLAVLALVGVFWHAQIGMLPQVPFLALIICIWCYDRIMRVVRLAYGNFSLANGRTHVSVEALPGEACRVTFHLPRAWTPAPGTHAFAYLPSVSLWMSHPFSIAWTDRDFIGAKCGTAPSCSLQRNPSVSTVGSFEKEADREKQPPSPAPKRTSSTISFLMSARTGMTRKLYKKASEGKNGRITMTGLLEGPYGSPEPLSSYGTVVLFAGGVGITHQLRIVRDLLDGFAAGQVATRKVVLVWAVRSAEAFEWVRPWMDELLVMPHRRELLRVLLYVTRSNRGGELRSASERVRMFPGRPDPRAIVHAEFEDRVGAMCVGVCGPGALADDVRFAAREVVDRGRVDFWEEAFTW